MFHWRLCHWVRFVSVTDSLFCTGLNSFFHLAHFILLLFWRILSSHVFPAWRMSGKPDRYLTTIKNTCKQGRFWGWSKWMSLLGCNPITLSRNQLIATLHQRYHSLHNTPMRKEGFNERMTKLDSAECDVNSFSITIAGIFFCWISYIYWLIKEWEYVILYGVYYSFDLTKSTLSISSIFLLFNMQVNMIAMCLLFHLFFIFHFSLFIYFNCVSWRTLSTCYLDPKKVFLMSQFGKTAINMIK